jgi:hypothetical protein
VEPTRGTRSTVMGRTLAAAAALALAGLLAGAGSVRAEEKASDEKAPEMKYISCTIHFEAEAWAFFVGRGKGEGHIKCDNGQEADALIKTSTFGIAVGKADVTNGTGHFAYLTDIDQCFGRYESSSAAVAAGGTAAAGGLVKAGSKVKLGFYATGKGGGGISRNWGVVEIERKE